MTQARVLRFRAPNLIACVVLTGFNGATASRRSAYLVRRARPTSPGEFVWRRSGLLKDDGFRKVLAPRGMLSRHYDRLGFQR